MLRIRTICVVVVAGAALMATAPVTATAQAPIGALDNLCVAGGREKSVMNRVRLGVRSLPVIGEKAADMGKVELGGGPICGSTTQEQLLLLTAMMIDRAALSAAKGVDAAQEALGRQRTLQERIFVLERAVDGLGSGKPDEAEVLISEVSAVSGELSQELSRLNANKALDDTALARLAEAHRSLNEVQYFGASAAAGGTLFTVFLNSGQSRENLVAILISPSIGLGSEFFKTVPERAARIQTTVVNTYKLKTTLSEVVAGPEKPADGEKRAKKLAEEGAKRIMDALRATGLTGTPRVRIG
jgi:hypothetical protein